jgi:hypothetical protein
MRARVTGRAAGGVALFVLAVCVSAVAGRAAAQERKADDFALVGGAALAPLDRLDPIFRQGGVEAYRERLLGVIEGLPFVGRGAMDTSRPVGLFFAAGDDLPASAKTVFMVPVKANAVSIQSLLMQGYRPLPGHADTVTAPTGFAIRRTANHILAGGRADAVVMPGDDWLAGRFKQDELLAFARVDLKSMRTHAPRSVKAFFEEFEAKQAHDADQVAVTRFIARLAREKLDAFELVLKASDGNVSMRVHGGPVELKPMTANPPRPAFPEGCFLRLHWAYPPEDVRDGITSFGSRFSSLDEADFRARADAFFNLALGEVVSVAAAGAADDVAVYVVSQHSKEVDLEAGLARIERIPLKPGDPKMWTRSAYEEGGERITRLSLPRGARTSGGYIDVLVRGKTLYAAFGATDARRVGGLSKLKPAGEIGRMLSAELDMERLYAFMKRQKPRSFEEVPEELFKGVTVSLDAWVEANGLAFEVKAPLSYLGRLMKMAPLR